MSMNRGWVLASHPQGPARAENFRLVQTPVPTPDQGQILVQTLWLSMDPYMRGRMSPAQNYTAGVRPGEIMHGGGVGRVVASEHPGWQVGELVESMNLGWQEYAVISPDLGGTNAANRVLPDTPPQAALSWLGMPGLTAYIGVLEIGRPKPGDTVVVSAASGAVGQIAGQIARLAGPRVVAIAGSDDKLEYCRSIGFDAGINYRTAPDLPAAVAAACPEGVDVFFDNTGGPIHDAVLANLANFARVAIVGRIAVIDRPASEDLGLRSSNRLIVTRATVQGLVVFDWWHRRNEAFARLLKWHRQGQLQFREDILDGIEAAPEAFLRMMSGRNNGKQLVRL